MAHRTVTSLLGLAAFDLVAGRSLWSSIPATHAFRASDEYLLKTAYPVGNGRLGGIKLHDDNASTRPIEVTDAGTAIPHGPPGQDKVVLNVDSLWSGGPFMSSDYTGANPSEEKYSSLHEIRSSIFEDGTGNVDALLGSGDNYGSYQTLGNLSISIEGLEDYTNYRRSLDLKTGIHTTNFTSGDADLSVSVFCSYPDEVCVYHISSSSTVPPLTVSFENGLVDEGLFNISCNAGYTRVTGLTQQGPPEGMKYDAIALANDGSGAATECSDDASLRVVAPDGQTTVAIVVGAGTNFDQTKGNAEHNYSFKGEDPGPYVEQVTQAAASKGYEKLLQSHTEDYGALESTFSLDLPDPNNSAAKETAELIADYSSDGSGDPFLEALIFDYSRHLLITSSRPNSLPANLQGRWTEELGPAWSSDYHANINLQMNYWAADQTGLGETEVALWNYMEQNWVPRGTETARLLYNASGWVVHNEMNIFGFTAMKGAAGWANYPAAPAWMMQHVWDNYEYTQDAEWFARQGYPLIKGVAEFWLSQLQDDDYSKDGSLVVNPCNSPEHGPTTFGCAHYQQEIHRTLETVLAGASVAGESDSSFLDSVASTLSRLDKGFHVSDWGGVKEWKLPDAEGFDVENNHRHLSHLTGWHPGYSVSAYLGGYSNATIQDAVAKTLTARGNGNGDSNPGWAKVWRAAAWARLNETEQAYFHLRYALDQNFAPNGFSMYNGLSEPFQIDANFGFGGAVLSMLVVDLPLAHDNDSRQARTVVLGPAIPGAWAGGSVKGLRIRGGGIVDFSWDDDGVVTKASLTGAAEGSVRLVNVKGEPVA